MQSYACYVAWTVTTLLVDISGTSTDIVYFLATSVYFLAAALLSSWEPEPSDLVSPSKRKSALIQLNDTLHRVTLHLEDSRQLCRAITSICMEAVAVLTRVAYPSDFAGAPSSVTSSLGVLFVVRLVRRLYFLTFPK